MPSADPPGDLILVLLSGGPYDGQDIAVSRAESACGSLVRRGHRYAAGSLTAECWQRPAGIRVFGFVDVACRIAIVPMPARRWAPDTRPGPQPRGGVPADAVCNDDPGTAQGFVS